MIPLHLIRHEVLRVLWQERHDAYLEDEARPSRAVMHPALVEDILLDNDVMPLPPGAQELDRLLGIPLDEDRDLPNDVIVMHWPSGRMVMLRYLETTQWRATVRAGVAAAHPWLRLPEPVPHPDWKKRWARWVFPAPWPSRRAWMIEQRIGMQTARPKEFIMRNNWFAP